MTPNHLALFFGFFAALWIGHLFYWQTFRPVMLKGIQFRIFARRDMLRNLAIDKKVDPQSFVYQELEERLCKSITLIPSLGMTGLVLFIVRNWNRKDSSRSRFESEASDELKELRNNTIMDILGILFLNSPLWFLAFAFSVILLWVIGLFKKAFLIEKTDTFVEALPRQQPGTPIPQTA